VALDYGDKKPKTEKKDNPELGAALENAK